MTDQSRIKVTEQDGVSIVRFVDKKIVDSGSIEQLGEELNRLVTEDKRTNLLLNFEGVEFLSSAALNKLISLYNQSKKISGRIKISNLREEIREVFKITNIDRWFDIRSTQDDALSAFKL